MLICPVCRSQNMDAAKFCGNCGNPFTRPSSATSSLINCAQGHIYSAVYEYCPYCPQPEGQASEFVTRVEEPITAVDPPNPPPYSHSPSPNDFVTRIDTGETLFETAESPIITPPAPPPPASSPAFAATEIIPAESPDAGKSANSEAFKAPEPPAPQVAKREEWAPKLAQPASAPESDRRTIVMADQSSQLRKTKGRIVGWLVTYSHNPDGEDYRIFAGYNRIGANPVCDIMLDDDTVSGSHSIIVYRDGRCLIKDDLSRNGTFVNGREITEAHPLQSYDQIRIGNTYLTFVAAQRVA